jgi:uncharacterized protein (TIGR03067 family)
LGYRTETPVTPALLILSIVVGAPTLKEPPKASTLVGRWTCTALTVGGTPDPQWKGLEYEFTADGRWIIYRDGKELGGVARTYKADPAAKPANLDACERADGVYTLGIYKVDGDAMSVVLRSGDGPRPTTFDPAA